MGYDTHATPCVRVHEIQLEAVDLIRQMTHPPPPRLDPIRNARMDRHQPMPRSRQSRSRRPAAAAGAAGAMGLLLLPLLLLLGLLAPGLVLDAGPKGVEAFVVPTGSAPSVAVLHHRHRRQTPQLLRHRAVRMMSEVLEQEAPDVAEATVTKAAESSKGQTLDRVNFAIISHPDSGKTTLTEKLLLYGGAIQEAGAVRSRASQRKTQSDFMEMEKQRGISISSTVLSFQYAGFQINLLDTPGHADFGEDTYRTLAAADNALMLVDAGKGLEAQTRKLFSVCRLRGLPIYTFINKMDRPARSPLELLDEIQEEMDIECVPIVWPIGDGPDFKGVLHRATREVHLYERQGRTEKAAEVTVPLEDPGLRELVGEELHKQLMEDVDLLDALMPPLDKAKVLAGQQTPLFFGSGINNFGVQLFLDSFLAISERPSPRESTAGLIGPDHPEFSGFVFKLVANLNPKHRDRVAFVRVVSGRFEKGMKVNHSRLKRQVNLAQASALFGQDRETIEEAYPGDVIGLNNPGTFAIGDSIYSGGKAIKFPGIPSFSPEVFAYIFNPNTGKYKNFRKGVDELLQEGAVQLLYERNDQGQANPILAAVGQLQFEVVQYRLKEEYGVETRLEPLTFTAARWSAAGWDEVDKADGEGKIFGAMQCRDRWGRPVLLFRNEWKMSQVAEEAPYLELVPWMMAPEED